MISGKDEEYPPYEEDEDEEELSSRRNVVHISMIHEDESSSKPQDESHMLVDDSRVDESLEELVRPDMEEEESELIPAIN